MKIEWKQCWRVGISVFILFLCISYWEIVADFIAILFGALSPLFVGLIIAYLVNILMDFYERYYFHKSRKSFINKSRRPVCMALSLLTMFGIIALLIYTIIPEMVSCMELFASQIPTAMRSLSQNEYISKIVPQDIFARLNGFDWQSYVEKAAGFLSSGISGAMNTVASVASSVFSVVVTTALGFIFAVYFLAGKEKLQAQVKRLMRSYLKENWYQKIMHYLYIFNNCFRQYIVGKLIDAVILGAMCAVGMLICRFPYVVMVSVLVGFTALIPVVGAYIGAIVGAIMMLTVSPMKALLFIIFIIVLQQIEGNLIYPKVMSSSVGLPGVWVLAAITVGGSISGIFGMLIGVPIAAALYQIIREDVSKREQNNKLKKKQKVKTKNI